jgi:hypothetical protein
MAEDFVIFSPVGDNFVPWRIEYIKILAADVDSERQSFSNCVVWGFSWNVND